MPSTIGMMGTEIRSQVETLPTYAEYLSSLPEAPQSEKDGKNCVFTGAGDSFAAAMATEHITMHNARSLDPYEVARQPSIAAGSHLYIISVSGRTKSNVEAARLAGGCAREVTAVTANQDSALARSCDNMIKLRFRSEARLTPGTASFTASLLACYSRVRLLPKISDLSDVYDEALSWCHDVKIPRYSTTFLVGTGLAYPFATYGKAKIFEVLGSKAQSQRTEQFSHMELFSLTEDDLTIILPEDENDLQARTLQALLEENSFKTALLLPRGRGKVEESLRAAISLQVLAWKAAKDLGMTDCAFINKSELLKVSDRMIYLPE